jgi:hypothetical protein
MATFLAYYWTQRSERSKGHGPLCERLSADTFEEALSLVEQRLDKRHFSFHSENRGRVLVVSAHVQYVELEAGDSETPFLPEGL